MKNNGTLELLDIQIKKSLLDGNLSKIARHAGVSNSTVSKTIAGIRKNPQTIKKIRNSILVLFHDCVIITDKSSSPLCTFKNKDNKSLSIN
jgi:hypothetical protein